MLEKYTLPGKDNTDLNVYRCGIESCSPGFVWGPGVRDHHIIHYVLSGKGQFEIGDSTYSLAKGDGFWIPSDVRVRYTADNASPWTYSWVGFHGLKAETILQKAGLDRTNPVFSYTQDDRLRDTLLDMVAAARPGSAGELMLTGHLYLFLGLMVENERRKNPGKSTEGSRERYVRRAVEYIARHYTTPMRITEMSASLGLDRSYLSMLFTELLGKSPKAFLNEWRMSRAMELLQQTDLTVSEVARSVGYEDPIQFSKTFKTHAGNTPTSFRKHAIT